jgi:nucleotide-binding universal stress UspA family protein
MSTKILVPVDGSECSTRAVEFAAEMAERYDGSLRVVHLSDAETDAALAALDRAREGLPADHDGDTSVEVVVRDMASPTANRVGQEILAYAKETDADHVVMGHHGAGVVERAILGSASETVVRGEMLPVTVVP